MIRHTWIDIVLSVLIALLGYFIAPIPEGATAVAAYAAASLFASIVGGIGGVALGATHRGARVEKLEVKHPGVVRRVYTSTLFGALAGAMLPVVGIWISDSFPRRALLCAAFGLTLALARITRLMWVFDSLLRMEESDRRDRKKVRERKVAELAQVMEDPAH